MNDSKNQPATVAVEFSVTRQNTVIQSTIDYETHVIELTKPKKQAVFVAHGMGQQLKFETPGLFSMDVSLDGQPQASIPLLVKHVLPQPAA